MGVLGLRVFVSFLLALLSLQTFWQCSGMTTQHYKFTSQDKDQLERMTPRRVKTSVYFNLIFKIADSFTTAPFPWSCGLYSPKPVIPTKPFRPHLFWDSFIPVDPEIQCTIDSLGIHYSVDTSDTCSWFAVVIAGLQCEC